MPEALTLRMDVFNWLDQGPDLQQIDHFQYGLYVRGCAHNFSSWKEDFYKCALLKEILGFI